MVEKTGYPYSTTFLGKSLIDESHPQFLGVYLAKLGKENVRKHIEEADCVIMLGTVMSDTNLGTAQLDISKTIYATVEEICIKHHYYKDIDLESFIRGLINELQNNNKGDVKVNDNFHKEFIAQRGEKLKIARFFDRLNNFLEEDCTVISDVGDCLFGSANLQIPKNSRYLGPVFYTSMGYAIPATLGVAIKHRDKRNIVIVGDGAFQMTGFETSCFVKYNLNPIIFVINNHGYTTQRFLKDGKYNELQLWNYHKLPEIFGDGLGIEVQTEDEFEDALIRAKANTDSFTIINLHFDKFDRSESLFQLTEILGQNVG